MGEKKEIRHEFRQRIEIDQAAGGLGEAAFQTLRHKVEDADDTYRAGIGETRKYVMPAMDAMALLAAKEMSKSIRAELNQIRDTSGKVYDLIGTGKLSMCDLSESGQLKKKLDGVEHISRYDKAQICKYRETAYDALLLKTALERKKAFVSEEPLKEHLQSKEFFDLGNQKTNEILKNYFHICGNDVLQHVNPASMSEKTIRRLIQSRGKNGFSDLDMAALRLLSRQIKYRQSRIHAGRLLNVKRRVEMLRIYSGRMDGTAGEGLLQITNTARIIQAVYAVGKFGLKAGIVSTSFLARYSGAEYLLHKMYRYGRGKEELLRKRAETAVKGSRVYQAASEKSSEFKNMAKEVRNRTNQKLLQSDAVQKYKKIQERENNYADEKRRGKSREMKKSPKSQRGGYQQQGRRGHRQQNRKEEDINNREDDDMNIVEEKDKRNENRRNRGKGRKKTVLLVLAVAVLLLMSILFLRSCRARDEPLPDTQRTYGESRQSVRDCPVPTEENKRLNLALSDSYHISEEHPLFYIGFPEENIFDVVFTIKDSKGNVLYETDYVKPGSLERRRKKIYYGPMQHRRRGVCLLFAGFLIVLAAVSFIYQPIGKAFFSWMGTMAAERTAAFGLR